MLKITLFDYQTGEVEEIDLMPETSIQYQCTIGRASSCNLVLLNVEVSRLHSRILFEKGQYYYVDLCSTTGSRINNEDAKANQSYLLKENDIIRIGGFVLLIAAIEMPTEGKSAALSKRQYSSRQWTKGDLKVQCAAVIDEAAEVKTFCFVADPPVLFTYKPGQFITLKLEIGRQFILSSYFISSTPSRPHSLEITVKRSLEPADEPNYLSAVVSNWLHDHIIVGSSVKLVDGPMGKFICFAEPKQKLLMLTEGNGITPIMSMMRWAYDTSADCDIIVHCSTRNSKDIIFQRELERMAPRFPNFRLAITTTESQPGEVWLGLTGRLTEAMLLAVAPDFEERKVYVCGSDNFIQGVKTILEGLAFPMENFHQEGFRSPLKLANPIATLQEQPTVPGFVVEQVTLPVAEVFSNEAFDKHKPQPMSDSPFGNGLPVFYIIAFLCGISIGLFNPFISTFMAQHHVDQIWIGINSTEYFLTIALATPLVTRILHQLGLRRTMMFGLALMGLSAPLFPLTTQLPLWFIIRAVMGFACCLYLVGGQTGLNHFCNDKNRAIVNGLYALAFNFGFGIGPVIGSTLYHVSPKLTFSIGSTIVLSGVAVVWMGLRETFIAVQSLRVGIVKRLTLPLHGAFAFGFAEATIVSLYPVYLLNHQFDIQHIGYIFAIFVVGGLVATVPVSHLADRVGRLKILFICVSILLFSMLSLSLTDSFTATQICAFIAGASMSPIFPLALTLIGEKLSLDELSSGSALFKTVYTFGCTAGPILSSVSVKIFGDRYIFSLLMVVFTLFLVKMMKRDKKMNLSYKP